MQVLCQKYDLQNFSRLDTAEERISDLEYVSRESLKTEKQREQRLKGKKNRTKYPRTVGQLQKMKHTWKHQKDRKERKKQEILEIIIEKPLRNND